MGNVHCDVQEWSEAETNYRTCLSMYIAHFGEDTHDDDVVETFGSLGDVLEAQGKLKEAKDMFEKCLKHYDGAEDEDVVAAVENAQRSISGIQDVLEKEKGSSAD